MVVWVWGVYGDRLIEQNRGDGTCVCVPMCANLTQPILSPLSPPQIKHTQSQESHALTEAYYEGMLGGKVPLSGEAAGRQTWHFDADRARKMLGVNGKDAAKKAGEEDMGFSAVRNPNSGDKVCDCVV